MAKKPFTIVAVQNDPIDNQLLATIFGRDEFVVETFLDHRKACQFIESRSAAHCLITDLELKDSADFELIKAVRGNEVWRQVPILVLAESVDKNKLLKLNQLKINGYIVKPFQPERLFYDVLKMMGLEVVTQKVPSDASAVSNSK